MLERSPGGLLEMVLRVFLRVGDVFETVGHVVSRPGSWRMEFDEFVMN